VVPETTKYLQSVQDSKAVLTPCKGLCAEHGWGTMSDFSFSDVCGAQGGTERYTSMHLHSV